MTPARPDQQKDGIQNAVRFSPATTHDHEIYPPLVDLGSMVIPSCTSVRLCGTGCQATAFIAQQQQQQPRTLEYQQQRGAKSTTTAAATTDNEIIETADCLIVKAPLKYIATYPCLSLRFPNLATASQRSRGESGVSLDFVLTTATNINTVAQEVPTALQLASVGTALPDFGATTGQQAGGSATYNMGNVQLEGQTPLFMLGLTATALPVTNPVVAGTLSMAFLQTFDGVDFGWGIVEGSTMVRRPSFTFYGGTLPPSVLAGRTRVKLERFPGTQSHLLTILVNGVPIVATAQAGVQRIQSPVAGAGEKFTVAGERYQLIELIKSQTKVSIQAPGTVESSLSVADFGAEHLFVGDISSLAALGRVPGVTNPPQAVLGLDILQRRPSMLLRAKENELWFE
jgi:hypothetical protein